MWDLQGNCLKTLAEHSRYVNTVAVNNESSIIASGSNDRSVIIWDLLGKLSLDSNIVDAKSVLFNLASKETDIPLEFMCPITQEIMRNPVIAEGKLLFYFFYFFNTLLLSVSGILDISFIKMKLPVPLFYSEEIQIQFERNLKKVKTVQTANCLLYIC